MAGHLADISGQPGGPVADTRGQSLDKCQQNNADRHDVVVGQLHKINSTLRG